MGPRKRNNINGKYAQVSPRMLASPGLLILILIVHLILSYLILKLIKIPQFLEGVRRTPAFGEYLLSVATFFSPFICPVSILPLPIY